MEEENKKEEKQEKKPLEKMTVIDLKKIALEIPGIKGVSAMKKDELLAVIKEHKGVKDEEPARKDKKKPAKAALDKKKLKGKISQLKQEKEAARGKEDRKRVDMLRRRLSRLKKQTRKATQA